MTKLAGACAIAALEKPVEVRNIPKACSERDFGNRRVSGIEQTAGADKNPLVVDVLANRAACAGKKLVHVAFRAMKFSRERRGGQAGIVAVTIDVVQHHRQQHGRIQPLKRPTHEHIRCVSNEIDDVAPAQSCKRQRRLRVETKFRIACEGAGEGPAGFC